jgi:hypothetical protein
LVSATDPYGRTLGFLGRIMRNNRLSIINEMIKMRVNAHGSFKILYPQSPRESEEDKKSRPICWSYIFYFKRGSQLHVL